MDKQQIGRLNVVQLSNVTPRHPEFLIKPHIPSGKITLMSGDPDTGKTWLMCAIASGISNGVDPLNDQDIEPAKVLILTAEDGLADTIRIRLDALDANTEQILAIQSIFDFDEQGLFELEMVIDEYNPDVIFIDPLFAYFNSKVDIHKANHTRAVMKEIGRLAEDYDCAIVGIRHLTKGDRNKAIYQGIGSIDISASARSELLVGEDPNNPDIHGIVHIKSNLAPKGSAIGYTLKDGKFKWIHNCDLTAEDILSPDNGDDPTERKTATF